MVSRYFRSAPADSVPPAPRSTSTEQPLAAATSKASRSPTSTAGLSAFIAAGRSISTRATTPSTSTRTSTCPPSSGPVSGIGRYSDQYHSQGLAADGDAGLVAVPELGQALGGIHLQLVL